MRGVSAARTACAARSISPRVARASPATTDPFTRSEIEPDRFEITGRRGGKTGFDDIDAKLHQRIGHFELFRLGHRRAGRLLAITQGRIENQNPTAIYTTLRV